MARGDSTTLALPGFAASTPLRRTVTLFVVLGFGLIAGSVAAVVETVMERTREPAPEPLAEYTVLSALRPLGRQTLAARAFEIEITDGAFPAFGADVVYYGAANVAATVDFAAVGPDDVRVAGPGDRVDIVLPGVVIEAPVLDQEQSGVVVYDTGFLDILFGASIDEYEMRETALLDLAARARASDLADEAAQVAIVEVRRRVGLLGARSVDVRFDR